VSIATDIWIDIWSAPSETRNTSSDKAHNQVTY